MKYYLQAFVFVLLCFIGAGAIIGSLLGSIWLGIHYFSLPKGPIIGVSSWAFVFIMIVGTCSVGKDLKKKAERYR